MINITSVLQRNWCQIINIYSLLNDCKCHLLMSKLHIPHISSLIEDPLWILINITICSTVWSQYRHMHSTGPRRPSIPKGCLTEESFSRELNVRVANKWLERDSIVWIISCSSQHATILKDLKSWLISWIKIPIKLQELCPGYFMALEFAYDVLKMSLMEQKI